MYRKTIIILTTLTVLFALGAIGLGIGWAVTSRTKSAQAEEYKTGLENSYRRGYYEMTYELSNTCTSLNKVLVSYSPAMQQKLLGEVSDHSVATVSSLSSLVNASSEGGDTLAFINKIGDYAQSLSYKISNGGSLSEDDKDNLTSIYVTALSLEKKLEELSPKVEEGDFSFLESLNTKEDVFATLISDIQNDIAYPSLIYDGPFSDALEGKKPVGEKGENKDKIMLEQLAKEYLPFESELKTVSECKGSIPSVIFSANKDGNSYFVDISKKGTLLSISSSVGAERTVYGEEECEIVAIDYLIKLGLENMRAVWASNYNNVWFINYCFEQDGVLCYSDMIKVKVSAQTKEIVGVECLNYVYNHAQRTIEEPTATSEQARAAAKGITVENVNLALIPQDGVTERLCWEVSGTSGDDIYFFYLSADTCEEVEIMRVIDSKQGKLLA